MSNKMKKYFLILILLGQLAILMAYDPDRNQFKNEYQYQLYQSWIEGSGFKSDTPAAFSRDYIKRIFAWDAEKKVPVYYDWDNHLIYNQREDLSKWKYSHPEDVLAFLENLLYRLNAADTLFLDDFLSACNVQLEGSSDIVGRFYPLQIEVEKLSTDQYNLIFYDDDNRFSIILPNDLIMDDSFYNREADGVFTQKDFAEKSTGGKRVENYTKSADRLQYSSLDEFIKANGEKRFLREILNNKIEDFDDFLKQEFPNYRIFKQEDIYKLERDLSYLDEMIGVLEHKVEFEVEQKPDGIMVYPYADYYLEDEKLFVGDEIFDLSALEEEQREGIASYIPQLLYGNRITGTELINLMFFHDDVETTVISYGKEREKYEFVSYVEVLLMLGEFWDNHEVSFNLREFRNVNGFIEFKGFFIARDGESEKEDLVEIWYHLNYDYHLDLIMVIAHSGGFVKDEEELEE